MCIAHPTGLFELLNKRVGILSPELQLDVKVLSLDRLEELGEALLDFSQTNDLVV